MWPLFRFKTFQRRVALIGASLACVFPQAYPVLSRVGTLNTNIAFRQKSQECPMLYYILLYSTISLSKISWSFVFGECAGLTFHSFHASIYSALHIVETCFRNKVLAQNIFKTSLLKEFEEKSCQLFLHCSKCLIITYNKNCKYRKISRDWSALENMTNVQMWISQLG